jgi:hypothetical protein
LTKSRRFKSASGISGQETPGMNEGMQIAERKRLY